MKNVYLVVLFTFLASSLHAQVKSSHAEKVEVSAGMAGCSIRIYLRTGCIIGVIMMEAFRAVWMPFTSFPKGLV